MDFDIILVKIPKKLILEMMGWKTKLASDTPLPIGTPVCIVIFLLQFCIQYICHFFFYVLLRYWFFYYKWIINQYYFYYCYYYLNLQTVSVVVSISTLTCIALDRWYAICYPLKFVSTMKRAKIAIVCIWMLALTYCK